VFVIRIGLVTYVTLTPEAVLLVIQNVPVTVSKLVVIAPPRVMLAFVLVVLLEPTVATVDRTIMVLLVPLVLRVCQVRV
jgi:hypothetical protein